MSSFDKAINEVLQIPEAKEAYDQQVAIIQIAEMIRDMRKAADLTQADLAKKINTKQSVISRLESPLSDRLPNLGTLVEIANACGKHFDLMYFSNAMPNNASETDEVNDQKLAGNVIHL